MPRTDDQAVSMRRATGDDADAITNVFLAARERSLSYLPRLYTDAETRAFFVWTVDTSEVWVAEADGAVAAFLALGGDHVDHLYVHPRCYHRGLGTALLAAAQAPRDRLELWVFQKNEGAVAFYERHGFAIVESTDGERNEEREPDHRMVWSRAAASAAA
ncbi:acyl-CoA N-acyltransferase [Thozetella sp. PMI_491]|nr:acyl-CoA N-acyltransferase [Thozetella sp. PMI_491]